MPFGAGRMVSRARIKAAAEQTGMIRDVILRSGEKVAYVPSMRSPTGVGGYVRRTPVPPSAFKPPVPRTTGQPNRLGFWHNASVGKANIRGFEGKPPSRAMGWTWTLHSQRAAPQIITHVEPAPIETPIRPRNGAVMAERYRGRWFNGFGTGRMPSDPVTPAKQPKVPEKPPEIVAAERQPATPPPAGLDVAALFQTLLTQFTGAQAPAEIAPAAQPRAFRPAYAPPQVSEEGEPVAAAGFDIKSLMIPAVLVGGLFMARKFL